jgi:hypothetical protein
VSIANLLVRYNSLTVKRKTPTSVHLDPDLMRDVRHAIVDREISQTAAFEQALRLWLKHPGLEMSPSRETKSPGRPGTSVTVNEASSSGMLPGAWEFGMLPENLQRRIARALGLLEAADVEVRALAGDISGIVEQQHEHPTDTQGVGFPRGKAKPFENGHNDNGENAGDAERRSGIHRKPKAG